MPPIRCRTNRWRGWFGSVGSAIILLAFDGGTWGQGLVEPETTLPSAERPAESSAAPDTTDTPTSAPSYYAGEGNLPTAPRIELAPLDTIRESLFGDVYAEGRWRPLTFRSFLSEGWLEPWAGAPAGSEGLTPRHGWLGAFDGVFYRLWLTTFGTIKHVNAPFQGDRYSGSYSIFLPLSRRFEVLFDQPFVVSNGTADPNRGYKSAGGDFSVTPRFLLSESKSTSQIFAVTVRTPTGSRDNGNGIVSLTPRYEFWTNPVGSWEVRGSGGFFIPMNRAEVPIQTAFTGGLAAGRVFTPHDVPFGDLTFYAASNFFVPLDERAARSTFVSVGPGTRFHIGKDYYFLNFWDFPVAGPRPYEYSMQFALLKVF